MVTAVLPGMTACTPQHDWREVRGANGIFTVLMPAKPAIHTREVNLGGTKVEMTMTGAEVDGVVFAVGTAELPDATQAATALGAMKKALVSNIGGTVKTEKSTTAGVPPYTTVQVEAVGTVGPESGGRGRMLFVNLVARDKRVYQVLVVGPERAMSREAADTFLSSFKPG